MQCAEPEQRLEGGHRGAAAVVAEDELVEVDLQVLGRDAAMGAVHPGLEVGDRAVGAGQQLLARARRGACAGGGRSRARPGRCSRSSRRCGRSRRGRRRRLTNASERLARELASICRRRRPEPRPRTSTATPTSAFLPRWRPPWALLDARRA